MSAASSSLRTAAVAVIHLAILTNSRLFRRIFFFFIKQIIPVSTGSVMW